jgi:response regulator RpfG family c-di-GMP phosphodiesterase
MDNIRIVSIDDNENNLILIEALCEEAGLEVKSFLDPLDALMYCLSNPVDMILTDYMMPELNGLEFIKEFRGANADVPIVMITAAGSDEDVHREAFELGANDFLSKPVNGVLFKARIFNLLNLYKNKMLLKDRAKLLEEEVRKATNELVEREHETLKILGKVSEYKDPETANHISRVAHYSKLLAKGYGLSEQEQELVFFASPFHDMGKVGIADAILLKPGKLDDEEFEIMKTHATLGYEMLKDSKSKFLQCGAMIAISHHEKYGGNGYPNGLQGEDINIYGRITAIADVFDALTSTRPYKKAWSFDDAIEFLKKESGLHFDPKLVDIFIAHINEVKHIFNSFNEEPSHA